MKKSRQVPATLIIAIAAGVVATGCSAGRRECRDAQGNLLPSSSCSGSRPVGGAHWVTPRTSGGFGTTGSSGGYTGG